MTFGITCEDDLEGSELQRVTSNSNNAGKEQSYGSMRQSSCVQDVSGKIQCEQLKEKPFQRKNARGNLIAWGMVGGPKRLQDSDYFMDIMLINAKAQENGTVLDEE
ncbi:hypothetical protein Tco_0259760 [Tanacetum coccineum]